MRKKESVKRNELVDETILRILSMNGRASLRFIGKHIGLSKHPTYRRVKQLEKRYGIKYLAEIDVDRLGYSKFLMLIKFTDKIPSAEEFKQALTKIPRVQLVLIFTDGEYDALIYVLAESAYILTKLRTILTTKTKLSEYPAKWYITPFYENYGYVPLRTDFIEGLKERVAKRKEIRFLRLNTEKRERLLFREFTVLKELNENGGMNFTEIDKKYEFDRGRSQYSYYKLLESGLLKRITISIGKLPIKYTCALFIKIIDFKKFEATRTKLLQNTIQNTRYPVNKYVLTGDIGAPFGVMLLLPVFDENDLEKVKAELSKINGLEIKTAVVTNVPIGKFCLRKFDNAYSIQQWVLTLRYKEKEALEYNYFEKDMHKPYHIESDPEYDFIIKQG